MGGCRCSSCSAGLRRMAAPFGVVASPTRASTTNAANYPSIRLLIVGDSGVGKSSLLYRFADDELPGDLNPGMKVDTKFLRADFGGKQARMQIWDVAGDERQRCIDDDFYGQAQGILVMYDVRSEESFESVKSKWLEDIKKYAAPDVVVGLVGNKADHDMLYRRVTPIDGRELTLDYDIPFFWETSATENMNVNMVFSDMARKIALTYLMRPTVAVIEEDVAPSGNSLKQREMATLKDQYTKAGQ